MDYRPIVALVIGAIILISVAIRKPLFMLIIIKMLNIHASSEEYYQGFYQYMKAAHLILGFTFVADALISLVFYLITGDWKPEPGATILHAAAVIVPTFLIILTATRHMDMIKDIRRHSG